MTVLPCSLPSYDVAETLCSELLWLDMEHKMATVPRVFLAHQDVIAYLKLPAEWSQVGHNMDAFHSSFLPQAIHTPFVFLKHHTPKKGSESTDIFLLTIFSTGILLNKPPKKRAMENGKPSQLGRVQLAWPLFFSPGRCRPQLQGSTRTHRLRPNAEGSRSPSKASRRPGSRLVFYSYLENPRGFVGGGIVPKGEGDANLRF